MSDLAQAFAQAGVNHEQLARFLSQHGHGGQLQTVTKTVHRDGKTFEQSFHVHGDQQAKQEQRGSPPKVTPKPRKTKSDAVKEAVAKGDHEGAVKAAGGDPRKVGQLVQGWADHGGSEDALRLRGALAKASGVHFDDAATDRMARNHQHFKSEYEGEEVSRADAKAAVAKHTAASDDDVKQAKAAAVVSQAAYGNATHVDLFRGITGGQAEQIKAAIARGDKKIQVAVDGVTSFTDNHQSALSFAKGKGGQGATSSSGVVIRAKVPVKSIVLSHKAFSQLKGEDEVAISTKGMIEIDASDIELH